MGLFNSGRPRTRVWVEDCLPLDAAFLAKLNCHDEVRVFSEHG